MLRPGAVNGLKAGTGRSEIGGRGVGVGGGVGGTAVLEEAGVTF